MRYTLALALLAILMAGMASGDAQSNDARDVCAKLVGIYCEPDNPDRPILEVTSAKGEFTVRDCSGMKTIVQVKPTERGLVFIEDPRDRNVFRLRYDEEKKEYCFEHLGRDKKGRPFPTEAESRKVLVKGEAKDGHEEKGAEKN